MSVKRARQLRKQLPRPEATMWNALRALKPGGLHFRRQVPLGPYFADFASHHPKIVVEIDGITHTDADRDVKRDAFMLGDGCRVLRISKDDVLRDLDGVVRAVLDTIGRSG